MISRIRRDPSAFTRYQHNRDLVVLVNDFADNERELPEGWEAKYDRTGKVTNFLILIPFAIKFSKKKSFSIGLLINSLTALNFSFSSSTT